MSGVHIILSTTCIIKGFDISFPNFLTKRKKITIIQPLDIGVCT
jgi:hypothetical protein